MNPRLIPTRRLIAGLACLVLTGATERDENTVRALRDDLVDPFGYRHPDHDSYTFHITMAYAILRHNGIELGKRDFLVS